MSVFVYEALRTPRAKAGEEGTLAGHQPTDLLDRLYEEIDRRNPGALSRVEHLQLGCVGQTGSQGGHLALVSKSRSPLLPDKATVCTINNFCVSGLTAVRNAAQAIAIGDVELALAGGVESMSTVPFLADRAIHYKDPALAVKTRFVPPVVSADLLATINHVEKAELDDVTARSHQKAVNETGDAAASMIAISASDGEVILGHNETVRGNATPEKLASIEPAFGEMNALYQQIARTYLEDKGAIVATHSVANCPGISDGAGMVLLGSAKAGEKLGLKPRARIICAAESGADPVTALTAGFDAFDKACAKAGIAPQELELIEAMEAFAITPALFARRYSQVAHEQVNPFGGHLAKGHPMGATGAILLSCLVDGLHARGNKIGATFAAGGSGVGSAMILQAA